MVTPGRASTAATAFAGLLTARPWLNTVAQIGGQPLRRLNCFLGRLWYKAAHKMQDQRLQHLLRHLVATLAPCVPNTDHDTWRYIDRPFLQQLSIAARNTRDAVVRLWLATMIWGFVGDNRGPDRVVRALSIGLTTAIARLGTSFQLIDQGRLDSAYFHCCRRGGSYLDGIGRSFFTKWLWAVGLGMPESAVQPLPQDDRVRNTARTLGPAWRFVGRNEAARYVDFCALAAAVANHLTPTYGTTDAEKVEYALFCA